MTNKHKNMLNLIKNRGNINYETSKRGFDYFKWWKNVHRQKSYTLVMEVQTDRTIWKTSWHYQ